MNLAFDRQIQLREARQAYVCAALALSKALAEPDEGYRREAKPVFMELENDGFGSRSAASDFIDDLEAASGETWDVVNPNNRPLGNDEITVGLFYQPDVLQRAGNAMQLSKPPFNERSRVPLAQWFVHKASAEPFLVVVNHFKSKGSCPEGGPDGGSQVARFNLSWLLEGEPTGDGTIPDELRR